MLNLSACLLTAIGVGVAVESGNTTFELGKFTAVIQFKPEVVKVAVLKSLKEQNIKVTKLDDYVQNIIIIGKQNTDSQNKVTGHRKRLPVERIYHRIRDRWESRYDAVQSIN